MLPIALACAIVHVAGYFLNQALSGFAPPANLTISGAVAQYGRGMIQDISQRLTAEFAACLAQNITAEAASTEDATPEPAAAAAVARPVKGFRLGLWAAWRAVARFFRGLFGGSSSAPAG